MDYVINLIKEAALKKLVIFGTGRASDILSQYFNDNISYYLDNDIEKRGKYFKEKKIYTPEILTNENKENMTIIIASMYYDEISTQLENLGFVKEKNFWNGMVLYNAIVEMNYDKKSQQVIKLEYPVNPNYRYGYGKKPHQLIYNIINKCRSRYTELLSKFNVYEKKLLGISRIENRESMIEPFWENNYMSGLDAIALYSIVSIYKPRKYMEIGSGNSTKFVYRAIKDNDLKTKIISIDPYPRAEIDIICDEIYRIPVEDLDLDVFDDLDKGDILFVDNSHRCFTNSDVTVFFLEILPRLKKGVIVQIHDVYLPYDYPDAWRNRFYSEQYLLACYLLSGGDLFEIILPNALITQDNELVNIIDPIWKGFEEKGLSQKRGSSFWLIIN
ncbi:putative O-methyltransferase YrrM [Natranaerovirga pectinivora]|uniref:Putative O-methyltransferase YrrM n=1 Tax=Natranaerovirga pectinivora TaxID=682400 RepID=A0A4R3MM62_9FIRM|nr:class I SAM-dependent methyltransferase [Natranaerovirga pectinivora]TCT14030.1 putative O-methyltransferase YrrM [Natranaerovirga pectinivora]